ncbi:MAG: 50S ribosomal protein L21 [Alphaproteobacteria bacterium]|nr:50S ribosomal protein L21 [Alphaproteobacteria bacterium]
MLAVIKTGGKQYKVADGACILVDKLPLEVGAKLEIKEVLMVDNGKVTVGTPFVDKAVVKASVVEHKKLDTVYVFKKSRRKNYRRKNGHRQIMTVLKIDSING